MRSPAQRHMMRASAEKAAQREQNPLRHATAYEQMLVKLAADRRTLSQIHSKERKAEKKRELLPFYLPWVTGVLETGTGAQDDILMTVMLWRLDAGDIAGALEIARYALRFGLSMPEGHSRTAPYMLAEEVALAALRARAAGESVDMLSLLSVIELTRTADMPDEVRARLHKVAGLTLRDAGNLAGGMAHLQRAIQLDEGCGVKKDIERLGRELNPKPKPAAAPKAPPKAAKKTTKKTTDSPAKRGRGRPRKTAG
ncbi:terminase endonuclease subunit [Enterobacter asburiae]|uniref:phage terminase small subunit n=1 Tax=Scandinavium sp. UTDF21-P1B TaxID=3446379 RepID=UPI00347C7866